MFVELTYDIVVKRDYMMAIMVRSIIHYFLHFLAPGAIARVFYRDQFKKAWLILVATMLVDLDHLLATPIFDPNRMSIGYHPLHSYPAIALYGMMLFHKKTRLLGIGLLFHMATDALDFLWVI